MLSSNIRTNLQSYNSSNLYSFPAKNSSSSFNISFGQTTIPDFLRNPKIEAIMDEIANEPLEHGIVCTKEGKILGKWIGTQYDVPKKLEEMNQMDMIIEQNPGALFIHNHPLLDEQGHPFAITIIDLVTSILKNLGDPTPENYLYLSAVVAVHPTIDGKRTFSAFVPKSPDTLIDRHKEINSAWVNYNLNCSSFGFNKDQLDNSAVARHKFNAQLASLVGLDYINTYFDDYTQ